MTLRFPASLRVIGRSVVDWWDSWLDMVMVTVVWLAAQLTIVLGPPATFGLYHVVNAMMQRGESLGVRGLIAGGRQYFWKAWVWGLFNWVVIAILGFNYQFYGSIEAVWAFYLKIIVILVIFMYTAATFYGLPYFMEMEPKSLKTALRNGMLTAMAAPFFTFILMAFSGLAVTLSILLVIPTFLGVPGLIPILGFRGVNDRLIAFGLRKPEKTPKEIEAEQGARITVQGQDLGRGIDHPAADAVLPDEKSE